ncbi:jasmonate-induced oxygenase 4-like isoform X3 [Physcomitrium patens]|uniref:jasmonate-induced oxygenase 4-like isoform X3 n=1 Tax=Physcomitrium patens TaxID=3218 RepID=UPI003CCE0109
MPQMVQGLVGQSGGLSSVPSRFVQPAHGSPRRTHSSDQLDAVPVIDMEGMHAPDQELRSRVVAEIAKACEEWGFFQVSEDGFFSLSQEEKVECAVKPGMCVGYGRFFETSDGVANWADNLILFSYGDEKKLANPCMSSKPKRFRQWTT